MIKPVKHSKSDRSSLKVLWTRVRYVSDPNDKNHRGKDISQSWNHNCAGQKPKHFLFAVARSRQKYVKRRQGKRGKRTRKKWEEYVYSSENGMVRREDGAGMQPCLSQIERNKVEEDFLPGPFAKASVRVGWHIDRLTGRCDCHFLVSEYDDQGIVWQNDGFGKGKKNLKLELERIEENLLRELNKGRPPDQNLENARQRHMANCRKVGKLTFAQKLAKAGWDENAHTLVKLAEQLGYEVLATGGKSITVRNKMTRNPKAIQYGIATLVRNCRKEKKRNFEKLDDPDESSPAL